MGDDHRKHKRYKAEGEVYVAFVVPNAPVIVGRILDVSVGGAGIQYLSTSKLVPGRASIKIFGLNSPQMEMIESKVIYDLESSNIPRMRRCGIKFEGYDAEVAAKVKKVCKSFPQCIGGKQNNPFELRNGSDKRLSAM
jgi:hypothetical protein